MVVVKQCRAAKTLMQLYISMLILIAGISLILATESESSTIKVVGGEISEFVSNSKSDNASPPIHFPEAEFSQNESSVQGTPILHLEKLLSTDQTSKMKADMKDKLPQIMAVILNDNDTQTQHDTQNTTYINLNVFTNESVNNITASKLQAKSVKLYNNELSKRTTIIFLVSVALVSTFFYILLVSLRKILERKYGDKELLVQNDEIKRDDYY